jgi:hypothetical protein
MWVVCGLLLIVYAVAVRWRVRSLRARWQRPPGPLPIDVVDGWVALPGRCVLVLSLVPFCFAGSTLMAFCVSVAHGLLSEVFNAVFLASNAALLLSVLPCLLVHSLNWPAALMPPDRRGGPGFQVAVLRQKRAGRLLYSTSPWVQKDGTRNAPDRGCDEFRRQPWAAAPGPWAARPGNAAHRWAVRRGVDGRRRGSCPERCPFGRPVRPPDAVHIAAACCYRQVRSDGWRAVCVSTMMDRGTQPSGGRVRRPAVRGPRPMPPSRCREARWYPRGGWRCRPRW